MLARYIIHFILLLCPDCIIYITKYRANYEFYNCLHNEKFTLSEYLQIQSQHSFFMSIHSGKAALLKYFWKANTKRILNIDNRVRGNKQEFNGKHLLDSSRIAPVLFCPVLHLITGLKIESSHQWQWKRVRKTECQCASVTDSVIQDSKSCTGWLKQTLSPATFSAFFEVFHPY